MITTQGQGKADFYTCPEKLEGTPRCLVATEPAPEIDGKIISKVMTAILTEQNVQIAADAANQHKSGTATTSEDIEAIKDHPHAFIECVGPREAHNLLAQFIEAIYLDRTTAEVRYLIPLPEGTQLAGQVHQEINVAREENDD